MYPLSAIACWSKQLPTWFWHPFCFSFSWVVFSFYTGTRLFFNLWYQYSPMVRNATWNFAGTQIYMSGSTGSKPEQFFSTFICFKVRAQSMQEISHSSYYNMCLSYFLKLTQFVFVSFFFSFFRIMALACKPCK